MKTRLCHFLLLPALLFVLVRAGGPVAAQGGGPPAFTPASIRFDDLVYTVTVQGDRAYVGMETGMAILDVKHPTVPRTMGQVQAPALGIAVNGDYAYAITSFEFEVVDVRNPYLPVKVAEKNFETVGSQYDVAVYGHYAYIGHSNGLAAIDVSDPYSPTLTSNLRNILGTVASVEVMKDPSGETERIYAYLGTGWDRGFVGDFGGGLRIVDVTDPSQMQEVFPCGIDSSCVQYAGGDVTVEGDYAYMACNTSDEEQGLHIYDIRKVDQLQELAYERTEGPAWGVTVGTNRAHLLVAQGPNWLHSLDVANKNAPRRTGRMEVEDASGRPVVSGQCLYLPQGARGLTILCDTTITPTPPPLVWLPLWITPAG